jgi:hypothetical protein
MTTKPKRKGPMAHAGLPASDRRSLACGLGTAALAGVPALPSAAPNSDDSVFQAMAALEQLKIHAEEQEEKGHYTGAIRNAADFFEGSASA